MRLALLLVGVTMMTACVDFDPDVGPLVYVPPCAPASAASDAGARDAAAKDAAVLPPCPSADAAGLYGY